ncbi:hypothetical protein ACO0RG_004152 [Hanseniaspora osmophila]
MPSTATTTTNSSITSYSFYCFYTLKKALFSETLPRDELSYDKIKEKLFPTQDKDIPSSQKISLFVTWQKKRHSLLSGNVKSISNQNEEEKDDDDDDDDDESSYSLRGCIGTFGKIPLAQGIKQYALHSAFHDTRFNPIGKSDLPLLKVKCSILHTFETFYTHNPQLAKANAKKNLNDWIVGVHGIELVFKYHHSTYSATFLPEVMVEQEWDYEDTFENLIYKALEPKGTLNGSQAKYDVVAEISLNPQKYIVKVTRYQSSIYDCTYKQFLEKYKQL